MLSFLNVYILVSLPLDMEKLRLYSLIFGMTCIVVFLLQMFIPNFTELFMLTPGAFIFPWQFLTAIFLHGSVSHLIYNMFALLFFGFLAERLMGSRKFLFLFLFSGILVNLITYFFYPYSLGASGAIMALIGVVAVLRPMMTVWAFGLIMPMFILALLWVVGSVMGIFGFGEENVGHIAHLMGLFLGLVYGFYLRLRKKKHLENAGVTLKTKVFIPEEDIRLWENIYLK
jgi:membrane associated rhomboid family serine protease